MQHRVTLKGINKHCTWASLFIFRLPSNAEYYMDKPCSKAAIKCTSFAMAQETVLPHGLFSDQDLLLHLLHSVPPTPCGCVLWPRLGKYLLLRSHLAIVSWNLFDSLTLGVPVFNCLHSRSLCAWIADCHLPSAFPIWPKCVTGEEHEAFLLKRHPRSFFMHLGYCITT